LSLLQKKKENKDKKTFTDSLHYVAIGNPVSKAIIGTTTSLFNTGSGTSTATVQASTTEVAKKAVTTVMPPLWKLAGRNYNYVRLAGLSGASAVILGAIGSHKLGAVQDKGETKTIFETANRFHFFHSLALMGVPLTKHPILTGTLMLTGTILFSGILYYRAFTGDKRFARFAPIGGTCLIAAWISMLL